MTAMTSTSTITSNRVGIKTSKSRFLHIVMISSLGLTILNGIMLMRHRLTNEDLFLAGTASIASGGGSSGGGGSNDMYGTSSSSRSRSSSSSTAAVASSSATASATRSRVLMEESAQQQSHPTIHSSAASSSSASFVPKRPKMFVGIFVDDSFNGCAYRKRHRELFHIWNDTRVCSLADYEEIAIQQNNVAKRQSCELIYTFIVGANKDPKAPTEIVDNSTGITLLIEKPIKAYKEDLNDPDVSLLNIRENMNDGKSPTFFYYASVLNQKEGYDFDYAMKLDADAMFHLHDYFLFAHNHLPPKPWNNNIFIGALRDKAYWPKANPTDLPRLESYWGNEYEGVHLYMAGQMYAMSMDLANFVAQEAPLSRRRIAPGGYFEGHEDHDVAAMVFHSPTPIHMIVIGKTQRFWEHPVKGQPRYDRIKKREMARMQGDKFEGRKLRTYFSTDSQY